MNLLNATLNLIGRSLLLVAEFFLKILRDMWLEVWKRLRKKIVRYGPVAIGVFALYWLVSSNPQEAGAFLYLGVTIIIFYIGFAFIMRAFKRKK